jgi:hypothetical protein
MYGMIDISVFDVPPAPFGIEIGAGLKGFVTAVAIFLIRYIITTYLYYFALLPVEENPPPLPLNVITGLAGAGGGGGGTGGGTGGTIPVPYPAGTAGTGVTDRVGTVPVSLSGCVGSSVASLSADGEIIGGFGGGT